MISVSGVRGVYGDGLDEAVAERFSYAFGKLYGGPVVVGRDSRPSGEMLSRAVMSGLRKAGMDVIDIGLASTPTTEMAVVAKEAAGGVIITASHNPSEWNGLKFIGPDGVFLDAKDGIELLEFYNATDDISKLPLRGVINPWEGANRYHIESILALDVIDRDRIAAARYTVCLDSVNGVGAAVCTKLLERLGCIVHLINAEPTGVFPHGPEPVPENIGTLRDVVMEQQADVGFAVDPDVDRLSVVDETGRAPGEEYTLALAADFIFWKGVRTAVVNLSTSQLIDEAADRHGAVVHRAPVGEINVVEKMREMNAGFGGEGNGGVIYPPLHSGRDAVLGIALILQYITECEEKLSELVDTFPTYSVLKEKIAFPEEGDWSEGVKQAFQGEQMDFQDGIKITVGQSWAHVRPSNTEPVIRLVAEAPTKEELDALVSRVRKALVK